MSQENVALVRRIWEDRLLFSDESGVLDANCEIHDHDLPDARLGLGRAGFERWTQAWNEAWESWEIENEQYIDAGDQVVVLTRIWARGRGSGVQVQQHGAFVISLHSGKVIRLDYFGSHADAFEAVGLRE